MPNHQSVSDFLICLAVFVSRHGYAKNVMWMIAKKFKLTNFGTMSWLHDGCFLDTSKSNHEKSLSDMRFHLQYKFIRRNRNCLVLFPEGGFLSKKKSSSDSFARKNKLPLLRHCTYPRTGALKVILETLGHRNHENYVGGLEESRYNVNKHGGSTGNYSTSVLTRSQHGKNLPNESTTRASTHCKAITKLVDVTIAYPDAEPISFLDNMMDWWPPCIIHVHYRIFDKN